MILRSLDLNPARLPIPPLWPIGLDSKIYPKRWASYKAQLGRYQLFLAKSSSWKAKRLGTAVLPWFRSASLRAYCQERPIGTFSLRSMFWYQSENITLALWESQLTSSASTGFKSSVVDRRTKGSAPQHAPRYKYSNPHWEPR